MGSGADFVFSSLELSQESGGPMEQLTLFDNVAPVVTRPEPEPVAGELACGNCGALWPGMFTGFWRCEGGRWWHWCSAGRPGLWHVARPTNGNGSGGDASAQ